MDRKGVRGHVKASMHPDTQVQIISKIDAVLAACVLLIAARDFIVSELPQGYQVISHII